MIDLHGEANCMAETLLQHLEVMSPNLPLRYKRLILARALSVTAQDSVFGGTPEDD